MKISFIVPEINVTGGMKLIFEYASRLEERGHEVTLYTRMIPLNPYRNQIKPYYFKYQVRYFFKYITGKIGIPYDVFPKNIKVKYVPLMKSIFIDNADAVIATAWTTSYPVSSLPERKGKKFYLIQDYETWNSNKALVDKSYTLPLNRIVISDYLKNIIEKKFGSYSDKILNGVNTQKFFNDDKTFNNTPHILFMDHLLPNKNVEGAIKTIIKLKNVYPDLIVSAFGVDKYHEIPSFVKFHKNITDEQVRQLYCNSDIFIFPSKYEGFGGPPAEAMACKCAVVGNAVAALPEYSINGETAILVEPEDENGLFEGAKMLIDDSELLKKISSAGYEHVKKVLDFDRAVNEFESLLMNI